MQGRSQDLEKGGAEICLVDHAPNSITRSWSINDYSTTPTTVVTFRTQLLRESRSVLIHCSF